MQRLQPVDAVHTHVGTTLFNMAVNPRNGHVYLSNTDSHNEVRFEGAGQFGGSTVAIATRAVDVIANRFKMPAFLTRAEEISVRSLLDEMAPQYGLYAEGKEKFCEGFYVDRVWYAHVERVAVAVVAFEIERGVPINERLRKDIFNLAMIGAPLGFIILPHLRILNAAKGEDGPSALTWYPYNARRCLEIYSRPFQPYVSIQILDADKLLKTRSFAKACEILWPPRLTSARARRNQMISPATPNSPTSPTG